NIHHFFRKVKDHVICLPCKEATSELVKCGEPIYIHPEFSPKTSNSPLHSHLESKHTLLYLTKLKEDGGWVGAVAIVQAFYSGYSFNTLAAVLADSNMTIDNLPPPSPLADWGLYSIQPYMSADLPEFSMEALDDFLVKFITADEQV
ncbi:hypothetical protein V8E55_008136, partial [Tylopilus felleus]